MQRLVNIFTSNIKFFDSEDGDVYNKGVHHEFPFGTPFMACTINGWFKTPTKFWLNTIGVFRHSQGDFDARITSIKGIKH